MFIPSRFFLPNPPTGLLHRVAPPDSSGKLHWPKPVDFNIPSGRLIQLDWETKNLCLWTLDTIYLLDGNRGPSLLQEWFQLVPTVTCIKQPRSEPPITPVTRSTPLSFERAGSGRLLSSPSPAGAKPSFAALPQCLRLVQAGKHGTNLIIDDICGQVGRWSSTLLIEHIKERVPDLAANNLSKQKPLL